MTWFTGVFGHKALGLALATHCLLCLWVFTGCRRLQTLQSVKSIQFSTFSGSEVMKSAEVEVYRGVYYDASKNPIPNGLLDPHMGPPNKTKSCATCNGDFKECPGHYGYLNLALPVFNVGYLPIIVDILKCICKVLGYGAVVLLLLQILHTEGNHGFSIGIDDVQPGKELVEKKKMEIEKGIGTCETYIASYNKGELELQPGCDAAQTLEAQITKELNDIREKTAQVCMSALHWRNSPLIMSQCGSKGSVINISQMIACVGQQSVGGRRAPNGFMDRSLPHFPTKSKFPAAKGFVASSFYDGLSATEFFFPHYGWKRRPCRHSVSFEQIFMILFDLSVDMSFPRMHHRCPNAYENLPAGRSKNFACRYWCLLLSATLFLYSCNKVFLETCISRYHAKKLEDGTSIDVTVGVPRIKEIINGAKRISTPIITAALLCDDQPPVARVGEVLGITRFGIQKMKDSVLTLASFEKTCDHLFNASVSGRDDKIEGVGECIIMGIPMQMGTGMFKVMQSNTSQQVELNYGKEPIMSRDN
nr:RNA polymerase III large subunit [Ipomoea batatas]